MPRAARVLEVGCGRGVGLPVVAARRRPAQLVGVDIDAALLVEAAERVAGLEVELVEADVRALPFPDASFDVVIDFGTLFHIADPGAGLREIARVLAPGGLFCHETPLNQAISHPVRSGRRRLPWPQAPELERDRAALMWSSRRRVA